MFRIILLAALAAMLLLPARPAAARDAGIAQAADAVVRQADGHRLLILGELHGTREIPLLVGDVVERLSRTQPVLLALEVPAAEQPTLDAALATRSPAAARRMLLARDWWQTRDMRHDGRRSLDMLDLVERMRRLRQAGRSVHLLAYDVGVDESRPDPSWRDGVMAQRVRAAYAAAPDRRVVMLTGNFHAFLRIPEGMTLPAPITTAGMRLADLAPASIRIGAERGEGWFCARKGDCRAAPVHPASPGRGEYTGAVTLPQLHVGRLVTVWPSRGRP